jgi:hypothetical protein
MLTALALIGAATFGCSTALLILGMCRAAADEPNDERIRDAMRR